ncbi:hypothetical protein AALP_AA5G093800 [Arabis alpina]|uniref:DUF7610 domain-containing protein n=1 Tax=Arabis alpina TaxID=50452 RepID=A0A087GVY6_ARAAL|nr:hypothetical protein AALP_AA5G093800 [Arabis alpina]
MKRKAKINSVLEKKLEELEFVREAINFNDINPNLYNEIKHSVLFVRTLLVAEISSRGLDKEGQEDSEERLELGYMAKRLSEVEKAFKTNQLPGHDYGLVTEPETGSVETNDGVVDAEQRPLFTDASSEEKKEVMFPVVADVKEEVVVRKVNGKRRLGFRALVCFGFIGLVGGTIFGLISDSMMDDNLFLTPT